MTQLGEAVARYHKILESKPWNDLSWARALQERMRERNLFVGIRPISPVLRPHFISRRQYATMSKAAECLVGAIDRMEQVALNNPALLSRIELLPGERMLAAVDPGYPYLSVTALLDTHLNNGTMRFVKYNSEAPTGVVYSEALSEIFYDAPPVKEFRKKYSLTKLVGTKPFVSAILKAWKEWGGKSRKPNIAILEFRQPYVTAESNESQLIAECFRKDGYATEVVTPDQLDFRNGVLQRGDFRIDLIYRRIKVQEFLVRFDLSHPLLRAYRDRKVCVVNNFRSEMAQKKALFGLLTDEAVTAGFPADEKRAVREFIPWTRVVAATKTTWQEKSVDLPDFILKNRQKLVLHPNDSSSDRNPVHGAQVDDAAWEKAMKLAMRSPWVVQEVTEPVRSIFPVLHYGEMHMREMSVDVHPHSFLGKVQGCSSWLTEASGGFSTLAGLAPTYILESR
ncbi:MAG: hypothetical protein ABSB67_16090 [Bryobacteraceae bacterium]|jgi:uncharacterized circularly permuted ATP-grasp superfamily protein